MGNLKNKLLLEKHSILLDKILRAAKKAHLSILACQPQILLKKMRKSKEKKKKKENAPKLKPRRDKICLVEFQMVASTQAVEQ